MIHPLKNYGGAPLSFIKMKMISEKDTSQTAKSQDTLAPELVAQSSEEHSVNPLILRKKIKNKKYFFTYLRNLSNYDIINFL